MTIQVRQGATWRPVPVPPTRFMYIRVGGQWKPILDMWVRDAGVWHKESSYSAPPLAAPSNPYQDPRYTPAQHAANHNDVVFAWNWNPGAGGLPAGDFVTILTDEGGSNWIAAHTLAGSSTGGTFYDAFTGVTQNKRYRVYVVARYPGESNFPGQTITKGRDDAWCPSWYQWATGLDPQPYQVAVQGWLGEYEWNPGVPQWASTTDINSWSGFATDGNFSSYWWSNPERYPGAPTGNSGEGLRFGFPGGQHLLTGIDYWPVGYPTLWYGVYVNGSGWQGGVGSPYSGSYAPLVHQYVGANSLTGGAPSLRAGNFDTSPGGVVDILLQAPNADNRYAMIEFRLVLRDWGTIRYDTYYTAAINSAYW